MIKRYSRQQQHDVSKTRYPITRKQANELFRKQINETQELVYSAERAMIKIALKLQQMKKYQFQILPNMVIFRGQKGEKSDFKSMKKQVRVKFKCDKCVKIFSIRTNCSVFFKVEEIQSLQNNNNRINARYNRNEQNKPGKQVKFTFKLDSATCINCQQQCNGCIYETHLEAISQNLCIIIAQILDDVPPKRRNQHIKNTQTRNMNRNRNHYQKQSNRLEERYNRRTERRPRRNYRDDQEKNQSQSVLKKGQKITKRNRYDSEEQIESLFEEKEERKIPGRDRYDNVKRISCEQKNLDRQIVHRQGLIDRKEIEISRNRFQSNIRPEDRKTSGKKFSGQVVRQPNTNNFHRRNEENNINDINERRIPQKRRQDFDQRRAKQSKTRNTRVQRIKTSRTNKTHRYQRYQSDSDNSNASYEQEKQFKSKINKVKSLIIQGREEFRKGKNSKSLRIFRKVKKIIQKEDVLTQNEKKKKEISLIKLILFKFVGLMLFQENRWTKSLKFLSFLLKKSPSSPIMFKKAECLYELGRCEEALKTITELFEKGDKKESYRILKEKIVTKMDSQKKLITGKTNSRFDPPPVNTIQWPGASSFSKDKKNDMMKNFNSGSSIGFQQKETKVDIETRNTSQNLSGFSENRLKKQDFQGNLTLASHIDKPPLVKKQDIKTTQFNLNSKVTTNNISHSSSTQPLINTGAQFQIPQPTSATHQSSASQQVPLQSQDLGPFYVIFQNMIIIHKNKFNVDEIVKEIQKKKIPQNYQSVRIMVKENTLNEGMILCNQIIVKSKILNKFSKKESKNEQYIELLIESSQISWWSQKNKIFISHKLFNPKNITYHILTEQMCDKWMIIEFYLSKIVFGNHDRSQIVYSIMQPLIPSTISMVSIQEQNYLISNQYLLVKAHKFTKPAPIEKPPEKSYCSIY